MKRVSGLLAIALSLTGSVATRAELPVPMAASPEEVGLSSSQLKRIEAVTKCFGDFVAVDGISFAVPIDEAIRVSEQLKTVGRVVRGRIGVQIAPVTKEVAESLNLPKGTTTQGPQGALVQSVESGAPAEKAGIEPGDIILKVDGKVVRSPDHPAIVTPGAPIANVSFEVRRSKGFEGMAASKDGRKLYAGVGSGCGSRNGLPQKHRARGTPNSSTSSMPTAEASLWILETHGGQRLRPCESRSVRSE